LAQLTVASIMTVAGGGEDLIAEAPFEEDTEHTPDLMV
jgi:hypothetical protein